MKSCDHPRCSTSCCKIYVTIHGKRGLLTNLNKIEIIVPVHSSDLLASIQVHFRCHINQSKINQCMCVYFYFMCGPGVQYYRIIFCTTLLRQDELSLRLADRNGGDGRNLSQHAYCRHVAHFGSSPSLLVALYHTI